MKALVGFSILAVAFALVQCKHTFFGTNVQRTLLAHFDAKYDANLFAKRIEYYSFSIPNLSANDGKVIQGILAYDKTHTGASANITEGGIGSRSIKLRMKSDRGKALNYNIYVYA